VNGGIQPTVELATNNGYPVYPVMGGFGNGGFGGFGGDSALWIIVLLALFGWGNNGNGNGFFNGGFDDGYAWLSNGQKEIMQNTNNGFDTLHLSNQLEGTRDAISGISNQICSSTADVVSAVNGGFYGAEISANNREMNRMNQMFDLQSQLASYCCENRLATCQTQNIVQNEGNQTRFADANNTRDIIESANRNSQAILDKLCQLELDAKNDKISDLQREVLMKDLQASQVAQTADIRAGQATTANLLVSELRSCPIPAQPVYGNTPIFQCNGNGCGCGYNQFV
jgi:hypothetical protein